jgi:hypothetical protein
MIRESKLNHYRRVSRLLASVAAVVLIAAHASAAQLSQYFVPTMPPVALRFRALDPAGVPINERWLLEELTAALQARSGWPVKAAGESTVELSGLRAHLDQEQSRIVFEYVHVGRNRMGVEWGETLTIAVPYKIDASNDFLLIDLRPSGTAELATRRTPGAFFLPTPKLRPVAELLDDFVEIMNNAPSVALHHSFHLNGAEEASASPETCIANFDRVLGRYAYGKDEERVFNPKVDDVFLYRTIQESVALKIAAVRNRGGSRVFYEAWVPFELRADGAVGGYDLAPAVKSEVHQVLQDQVLQDQPVRNVEGGPDSIHDSRRARK